MDSNTSVLDTNTIAEKYGSLVSSICRRMIQNAEDAKDAAQEAWAEIIKGLPSYKGEAKLSTWIYTVTYHSVMHFCQKDKIYSTKFLRDYFHGDSLEVPCDIDYDKSLWIKEMCDKCLTGILHCLDPESRLAYLFRDVAQLSYEDIAVIMEQDPAAARKTVSRSRKKLRNFLNNECVLFNPSGSCKCRMKNLVEDIMLPQEYQKLRRFVSRVNLYKESQSILPQKNYWISI